MNIRRYFDLSQPTFGPSSRASGAAKPTTAGAVFPAASQISVAWQIATYCILLLSILASRFLDLYRAGVAYSLELDWSYLLFIAIVSLLAFPIVYDKAQLNKDKPILLQIGLIFTAGMGWEKIVATAIGR